MTIGGVDWSNAIPTDKRFSHMNTAGTYQERWFEDWTETFGDYEGWFDTVHYYGVEPEYVEHLRPADCCYFIKEVPLVGCEIISKAENVI